MNYNRKHISLTSLGTLYPLLSFVARVPFSMMLVGTLTLVVVARDSSALGGLCAAVLGVANSVCAPLIGMLADKHGQRPVLFAFSALNSLAMVLLVLVTQTSAPDFLVVAASGFIGATIPLTSPMSRIRYSAYLSLHAAEADIEKLRTRIFAQESVMDEISFVGGPVLVGLFGTAFGPATAVYAACAWTLLAGTWFALHPSSALPAQAKNARHTTGAPATAIQRKPLLPLLLAVASQFAIGTVFGSTLTSLTALLRAEGQAEQAGIWYGLMGLSSALLALAAGWFSPRFTHDLRLVVFALIAGSGLLLYCATPASGAQLGAALLLTGLGIGPLLVAGFALGAARANPAHITAAMTALSAAITLGQSLTSAVVGSVAEHQGAAAALNTTLICATLLLAVAFTNLFTQGPAKASAQSTTSKVSTE